MFYMIYYIYIIYIISVCIGWSTNISDWCACPDHPFLQPGSHSFHYQVSESLLLMSNLRKKPELMITVPFLKIPPNPKAQHLQKNILPSNISNAVLLGKVNTK